MFSSDPRIAIIGAGGHGAVVAGAALTAWPSVQLRIFDAAAERDTILGLPIEVGDPSDAVGCPPGEWTVCVAIGNNAVRQRRMQELSKRGYRGSVIVHPAATVSREVVIGEGTVILAGAVVNARARIGAGCVVNTSAVVEHDVSVGDYTHLSPGCVVAGGARVGARCWVGANAVVRQGVELFDDITLGALAFAGRDIRVAGTYVGAPARRLTSEGSD